MNFPSFLKKDNICKNVLDYVITQSFDRIMCINSSSPLGDVKQGRVVLEWNYRINSGPNIKFSSKKFNYYKAYFEKNNLEIFNRDWSGIFGTNNNVNDIFNFFIEELHHICQNNTLNRGPLKSFLKNQSNKH